MRSKNKYENTIYPKKEAKEEEKKKTENVDTCAKLMKHVDVVVGPAARARNTKIIA